MLENWNDVTITQIKLAIYVEPGTGSAQHTNRPSHGLVMDDSDAHKAYCFSDGTVLETRGHSVFYLPQNSTYRVKTLSKPCGCWAINFLLEEEICEKPFVLHFKNSDSILECFQEAVNAFKRSGDDAELIIKRNLYDIILKIRRESRKEYVSGSKRQLIQPAVDHIHKNFTDRNLTVEDLAKRCQMSENYFRRIFGQEFGMSPKEYIIERKIRYAKALLSNEQFSVSEIAELCGYFEPCHFSREFSRRVGIPPSEYAKASRK